MGVLQEVGRGRRSRRSRRPGLIYIYPVWRLNDSRGSPLSAPARRGRRRLDGKLPPPALRPRRRAPNSPPTTLNYLASFPVSESRRWARALQSSAERAAGLLLLGRNTWLICSSVGRPAVVHWGEGKGRGRN